MARAISIIHPSEVIRQGLLSILENEVLASIHSYDNMNLLTEGSIETFSEHIIILRHEEDRSKIIPTLTDKSIDLIFIALTSTDNESSLGHFDYIFNLNQPAQELVDQIHKYFARSGGIESDDELTMREKDVLRLIALGHTNKSIAETLYISTHTVISHRKNITDKLGIKSIPGLTVYAIIQKLISQADITKDGLI